MGYHRDMRTMPRFACGLMVLIVLLSCRALHAKPRLSDFKSAGDRLTLKPGEKLIYTVRWLKMPVGRAVLRVKKVMEMNGKRVYHLHSRARAGRVMRLVYNVNDSISSFVEVDGFRPVKFDKRLREGKRKKDELIEFDWEKKEAAYLRVRKGKKTKRRTIVLSEGAQDPLSCLYFLRGLPLEIGKECTMIVATERKCWNVVLKPLREEKLKLRKLGTFETFVVEPSAEFEGLFVHDKKLTIWLEKETKIPLKMVADIPVGSISLILAAVEDTSGQPESEEEEDVPLLEVEEDERKPEKILKVPWESAGRGRKAAGDQKDTGRRSR